MNLDQLDRNSDPAADRDPSVESQRQLVENHDPSQKGLSLSSTPSDTDWVSPFTLPPLPAFRRDRDPSSLLKSPEQLRQRAGSGAYYAAAWGSPYATPSPHKSPHQPHVTRHSIDSETSSPLHLRRSAQPSASNRNARHSIDSTGVLITENHPRFSDRKSVPQDRSERPNWLSDSDGSDHESPGQEQENTPRGQNFPTSWENLPGQNSNEAISGSHQVNESVATITPRKFRKSHAVNDKAASQQNSPADRATTGFSLRPSAGTSTKMTEKPLPIPPRRSSQDEVEWQKDISPISPSRPRPGSMQSFQRPKKKVVWKGKTCIIALPLTDRESGGLPPLLTSQEFRAKIDDLINQGYNIRGFELDTSPTGSLDQGAGQSRPLFPDPQDVLEERRMRKFTVQIPNQAEWDAWVDYLKEEKLRALGVTPSNSEAPASSQSPFSSSLSRSSSRFQGPVQSPPVASSSAASNPLRATSNPFSPTLNGSSAMSSQIGSGTSSQYNSVPGSLHGYKQSIALQGRMVSPYEYSVSQPMSLGPSARSPPQGFGPRNFSPINPAGIQSLGEVLSPVSSLPESENLQYNSATNQSGRFQPDAQSKQPGQRHDHSLHVSTTTMPQQGSNVPRATPFENFSRPPLEIAHPTPRSHRHNLSAALQKEIDDAESAWEKQSTPPVAHEKKNAQDETKKVDENIGDYFHDELPILKRPETMNGTDDKSEIETNPSIAASPLLTDDKNPFANWQALSDAAKGPPENSHKVKPSVSKFNVKAPEFDPRAGFSSSNFIFGNGFQPFTAAAQLQSSVSNKPGGDRKSSASRFNVDAPAFTPRVALKPNEDNASFKFSSATFNVAAPEFNPSSSVISDFKSSVSSGSNEPILPSNSIFGQVVIDPRAKTTRRASKALPILRPRSKDGSQRDESEDLGGSSAGEPDGRPSAPVERQKRARREGSDGDRSPTFADSTPFNHSRILSQIVNDESARRSEDEEPTEKAVDGWAYIPADEKDENAADDIAKNVTTSQPAERAKRVSSPDVFHDEGEAARQSDARPSPLSGPEASRTEQSEQAPIFVDPVAQLRRMEGERHKPRSSLSALAKPFEFKASIPAPSTSEALSKPRKSLGLEASRFAPTPSPPSSSPPPPARLNSPPTRLYEYIKSEDEPSVKDVEVMEASDQDGSISSVTDEDQEAISDNVHGHPQELVDEVDPPELSDNGEEPMPSFEEIDAVMRQFEDDPELGIERNDSPIQSTPLVDMGLGANFRSDAPSPSPRRARELFGTHRDAATVAAFGLGIGVHRLNSGKEEVSDWNETLSATEEDKLESRAQFFDGRVNDLVDGILEHRLGPLEKTLQSIQHSISAMTAKPPRNRRSTSTDVKESDADDEDDYNAFEGFSSYRSRSPMAKRERKTDTIRIAVAEALAAFRETLPPPPTFDMSEINAALSEMGKLVQQSPAQDRQNEMRLVLEDVISHHPRLRGSRVQQDHEAGDTKYKLQIDGLESMLRVANERADEEMRLRRESDTETAELKRRLAHAEEKVAAHREASEEAQQSMHAFIKEKEAYKDLEEEFEQLSLQNRALQNTLEEYRESSDQWRKDIREERSKNKELSRTLFDLREQLDERSQSRQMLRSKVERLQVQMSEVVQDLGSEQAEWRKREHELLSATAVVQNTMEMEIRRRENVELELNAMVKQHKENLYHKDRLESSQQEVTRLQNLITSLQEENKAHQDVAFRFERELGLAKTNKDAELATATSRLQAELEGTTSRLENLRSDFEVQVLRLQRRLDTAELDLEEQKAKHDVVLSEIAEAHAQVLREADEKREAALEEQHASHEKKLTDLRERHTRALHNSSDDRHRLEFQLNEKLAMSEDKVKHLEGKLADLDERLDITKSAARAAVEAAMAKGINLPTPAPSVVASPPQRTASASMPLIKGSELPEKISPQALRESIMVLQDQLQNREQQIEKLEAELASVDKEAPNKVKERENEIGWLRELLTVRVDDLEDIINTLGQQDFDRDAAKDAAIRLKANLQMEQQLRERPAGLASSFPSISTLSSYAQSPRGLPLAAAAAWGNWRKARDTSIGAISDLATNLGNQTPSKSTMGSPASFLSGIMTPPSTNQKTPNEASVPPPAMRPLAAAAAARKGSSEARPLRAYNAQPRTLSSRQQEKRPLSIQPSQHQYQNQRPASPHTPISNRPSLDLGDDIDEDASPLDGRETRSPEEMASSS